MSHKEKLWWTPEEIKAAETMRKDAIKAADNERVDGSVSESDRVYNMAINHVIGAIKHIPVPSLSFATLNPEDFTEPGPVVGEVLNPDQNYYSDDDFRSLHHAYCRADAQRKKAEDALKIARISLYDVSIAPGGLVGDSYRKRAVRAIVQINALKIEDKRHD